MAYRATLTLEGKAFDVLDCRYKLTRDEDNDGRPTPNIYSGIVHIHNEYSEDSCILEEIVSQLRPISGSIVFKTGNGEIKIKELVFEDAYIAMFEETMDIVGTFEITPQLIKPKVQPLNKAVRTRKPVFAGSY